MKNEKLSAILGRDVQVGEVLTAVDLEKVTAALPDTTTEKPENAIKPIVATVETVDFKTALTEAMAPVTAQLTAVSERLAIVEGSAGADPTIVAKIDKGEEKVHSWNDPTNALNQHIAKELGEL